MEIRRIDPARDMERLEDFLRERWRDESGARCWLPQRLEDLRYRVGALEELEGAARSADWIFLWEEAGRIDAALLPDGENLHFAIRPGCEALFPEMLAFSERSCLPLFHREADGSRKFWVAVSEALPGARDILTRAGYEKYPEQEHLNVVETSRAPEAPVLPEGFRLCCGEDFPDEEKKWSAQRLGFHPDWEAPGFRAPMAPCEARRRAPLYPDSFECLVLREAPEEDQVCGICFVYVDRLTGTALIEPLSVREPYRRLGLGRALLQGALRRCRAEGIGRCCVTSFGWRRDFYAAAGFTVAESVSFWHRILR